MLPIVTATEMKKADQYTQDYFGMNSLILMERAALCIADEVTDHFDINHRIMIVCGYGNNGGDGVAAARILSLRGYDVDVFCMKGHRNSKELDEQIKIYEQYGFFCNNKFPDKEYDIIIDAIFGVGLSRNLAEPFISIINKINEQKKAYIISIDIPSGIHADTGKKMGACIKADLTITFSFYKQGMLVLDGKENSGVIHLYNIGIEPCSLIKERHIYLLEENDCNKPDRSENSNKGTCGKLCVVAGSDKICGAAVLSSTAAYRIGAGMVHVITHEKNRVIIAEKLPEAIITCYEDTLNLSEIESVIDWCDGILIGPGIGRNKCALELMELVLRKDKPTVIDADGINIISGNKELFNKCTELQKSSQMILTPHMAELSRLMGIPLTVIQDNLIEIIIKWNQENKCLLVAKDARTIVGMNGKEFFLNCSGNSALATAGTGDVLAGMIAGLMVQNIKNGFNLKSGVLYAVWLHGHLADLLVQENNNKYSLIASDLCERMKKELR